jgi:homoserine O-acetyltransferase
MEQVIDLKRHFIVCANILGSCYGSTGPLSIDPSTKEPYYSSFPQVTIRDMVKAHTLLREYLGIEKIFLLIGGSMGGYQAMEWCLMESERIVQLFLLATSATESAWGIAVHTAQRLAIEADQSWQSPLAAAGAKGLKAARAIGMLTYRNYAIMVAQQTHPDSEKLDHFKASSYIQHQGGKLVQRFNAFSYWLLTKSMDSHHLGRGRGGNAALVLKDITQKTLIIGINSDMLCPLAEQQFLHRHIPNANLVVIDSNYGHDGFMVESAIISQHLARWITE